jgi:sec-independent protein translocase protein TatA
MTIDLVAPLIAGLGTTELIIILAVVVLLFGASKLPDLARNSGRALRIFKSETKGLMGDDTKTPEQREIEARNERDQHPTD